MKKIVQLFGFFLCISFGIACSSKVENDDNNNGNFEEDKETSSDCKFKDGTYSATVDYNNSETGHSATYTLDVDVENCQVVKIDFPNGGYLDDDHITYGDLDETGSASVEGEDGKSYQIQVEE